MFSLASEVSKEKMGFPCITIKKTGYNKFKFYPENASLLSLCTDYEWLVATNKA